MLTAISLFSGIGGIDLAFSLAGFDILAQVEIDAYCRQVLSKHAQTYWQNAQQFTDVRQCGTGRAHPLPYADVIFGGFPCQNVSSAGKREGIREGNHSGLWFEFARLISEIRPRAVLLENVAAITVSGRGGDRVIADLAALGYVGQWGIISASDAGAPHRRDRWFCVGYNDNNGRPQDNELLFTDNSSFRHNGNDDKVDNPNGAGLEGANREQSEYTGITQHGKPDNGQLPKSRLGRNVNGVSAGVDIVNHRFPNPPHMAQAEHEPSRTIRAKSPHHKQRLQALGNAVVPQVIYPIALELHKRLTEE